LGQLQPVVIQIQALELGHPRQRFGQPAYAVALQLQRLHAREVLEEIRHIVIKPHVVKRQLANSCKADLGRQRRQRPHFHAIEVQRQHPLPFGIRLPGHLLPGVFDPAHRVMTAHAVVIDGPGQAGQ